jgi:hypothetical protein
MIASEALYFTNAPVAHIVQHNERKRLARIQAQAQAAFRAARGQYIPTATEDPDPRNVWTMIANIDHLMNDPTECAARDANYAAINASMDRARDAALVRLGYIDGGVS